LKVQYGFCCFFDDFTRKDGRSCIEIMLFHFKFVYVIQSVSLLILLRVGEITDFILHSKPFFIKFHSEARFPYFLLEHEANVRRFVMHNQRKIVQKSGKRKD
ncbi:MAG: hypothetical protein J6J61_04700, partial [Muribaculaceae bacterium]|nr:hypothetical protein [Muribaculaceae bacterium]